MTVGHFAVSIGQTVGRPIPLWMSEQWGSFSVGYAILGFMCLGELAIIAEIVSARDRLVAVCSLGAVMLPLGLGLFALAQICWRVRGIAALLTIDDSGLTIEHPTLLVRPMRIPRSLVHMVCIDGDL